MKSREQETRHRAAGQRQRQGQNQPAGSGRPEPRSRSCGCSGQLSPTRTGLESSPAARRSQAHARSLKPSCSPQRRKLCFSQPQREGRNLTATEQSSGRRRRHAVRAQSWARCHRMLNTWFLVPGTHPLEKTRHIRAKDRGAIPNDRVKQQQSNRQRGKEKRQNICSARPPRTAPQRLDSLPKRSSSSPKSDFCDAAASSQSAQQHLQRGGGGQGGPVNVWVRGGPSPGCSPLLTPG